MSGHRSKGSTGEVARDLARFIISRGGALPVGNMGEFYEEYPHHKKSIKESLRSFCFCYSDLLAFRVDRNEVGGGVVMPVHIEHQAACQPVASLESQNKELRPSSQAEVSQKFEHPQSDEAVAVATEPSEPAAAIRYADVLKGHRHDDGKGKAKAILESGNDTSHCKKPTVQPPPAAASHSYPGRKSQEHEAAVALAKFISSMGGSITPELITDFYLQQPVHKPAIMSGSCELHEFCDTHSALLSFCRNSGSGIIKSMLHESSVADPEQPSRVIRYADVVTRQLSSGTAISCNDASGSKTPKCKSASEVYIPSSPAGHRIKSQACRSNNMPKKPGDWTCLGCKDHQFAKNDACRNCGAAKPGPMQSVSSETDAIKAALPDIKKQQSNSSGSLVDKALDASDMDDFPDLACHPTKSKGGEAAAALAQFIISKGGNLQLNAANLNSRTYLVCFLREA